MPGLDRHRHDGVRRPPRRYELRLQDVPVRAVPEPLAAADAFLLRPVHRDGEEAPESRAVEHLQPHHVRHDVHERLLENRRAAAREVVAYALRARRRPLLAFDPPVLLRELVHRVRPALVVAQRVHRVARPQPPEEAENERPEERPPLVQALRPVPHLADAVECWVQDPAEPGQKARQLLERLSAVRRFRGPAACPPTGVATVLLPVLSAIAATSSDRAISLISFMSRFASAHLADQSATSGAKSAGT